MLLTGQFSSGTSRCLPDLDEEGPDDVRTSSGDVTDGLHFTAVPEDPESPIRAIDRDAREVAMRASSAADLEADDVSDLQTIVEELVMQNKQFQRILDRPRRELRRSPTQSSSGTSQSERDSDSCLDLAAVSHDDAPSASSEEPTRYEPTKEMTSSEECPPACAEPVSHTPGGSPQLDGTEPGTDCHQVCDALNIESRDNVEYVSLFDYGTNPTTVTPVPPTDDSRDALARSVAEPCRRVVRRIKDLHQAGQTEVRQLLRGIRTRSIRLSRHIEEETRSEDKALTQPAEQQDDLSMFEAVHDESCAESLPESAVDEVDSRLRPCSVSMEGSEDRSSAVRCDKAAAEKERRPVWRCDVLSDDDNVTEEDDSVPSPSEIRWPTPKEDPAPSPAIRRRTSGSRPSYWRPLSLIFEPQKSRQKPSPTLMQHATSLERLNSRLPMWSRRSFEERTRRDVSASYGPSLTSLRSDHRFNRTSQGGAVRWFGKRVLQLVLGDVSKGDSASSEPDRSALGARLAAAAEPVSLIGPLQSPLLSSSRRQLSRADSVTSRGSSGAASASSEGESGSEHSSDASGFYEHDMDILEHVDCVEVCW